MRNRTVVRRLGAVWSVVVGVATSVMVCVGAAVSVRAAQSVPGDLDALMARVMGRRDDNWRRLQQYILNERDVVELLGPGQVPVFGEQHEYVWSLRDGFFVKSPIRINGVGVSDAERRTFEERHAKLEREREAREAGGAEAGRESAPANAPAAANALISQTRDPQFISSAYFLRFKFEEGKYALVGRELLAGVDTLKVEYYPARLFSSSSEGNGQRLRRGETLSDSQRRSAAVEQAANKVSMVTLWVEPKAGQIVQYTFSNVNRDFLPAAWLARLDEVTASMRMNRPFAATAPVGDPSRDVWLPQSVSTRVSATTALGRFRMTVNAEYSDYKLAETSSRIK